MRVFVDGVEYAASTEMHGRGGSAPTDIVIRFPVDMDRATVDTWVPATYTADWRDPRQLHLVAPASASFVSFKLPEVKSADGVVTFDLLTVDVSFPAMRTIRIFTIADLTSSTRVPQAQIASRVTADGVALSPDGRTAFVYDGLSPVPGPAPALVDLATGRSTPLSVPAASDGWFAFADWIGGRFVVVGRSVWVGSTDGTNMRAIADTAAATGGTVWFAYPDPAGERVAVWSYNTDGHIAVVDLATGGVRRITGPFRRCGADGGVQLTWSKDGSLLAGTDCPREEGPDKGVVRIVELAADRTLRTIAGGAYGVTSTPAGELIVTQTSGETGAGARSLGTVMSFDGKVIREYRGFSWSASPDGRYILQSDPSQGLAGYTLIDTFTGLQTSFGLDAAETHWLPDGRLATYSFPSR
ncbi:MAG TPA: hypothetical protein VM052_06715 [Candidatus Limnocylindrales bacterium]|nr:hypothetical protein [Candidatus Limnocylindrales bacterium]